MIIADTSALLALFNRGDHAHTKVVTFLAANDEPLVVSLFVVAPGALLRSRGPGGPVNVRVAKRGGRSTRDGVVTQRSRVGSLG